jgi:hypothetical protein
MRLLSFLGTTLCLTTVGAGFVRADDLDKSGRPPAKEPAYQSKGPKYALLAFGPEARTRIWLVLDETTVYVDRNGNGDLTEAGEKVAGKRVGRGGEESYTFEVGELRDEGRRHLNATLTVTGAESAPGRDPRAMVFSMQIDVEVPGHHGLGEGDRVVQMAGPSDLDGALQFADRPEDAPVLHFGGPWTVALYGRPTFRVNREMEMYLALGTPGRGKGTFVYSGYEGLIPPGAYPRAEITFPGRKPGDPAVKVVYELKGRC